MGTKLKRFLIAFVLLGAVAAYYGWHEFNRKPESTSEREIAANFTADSLARYFELNDSAATAELGGKVIQVEGTAMECTNENGSVRIRLQGTDMSGIICQFEPSDSAATASLSTGAVVCLKGQCNAYQKVEMLPGGDVLLSNCVVTPSK